LFFAACPSKLERTTGEGTSEIQRLLIARHFLGKSRADQGRLPEQTS